MLFFFTVYLLTKKKSLCNAKSDVLIEILFDTQNSKTKFLILQQSILERLRYLKDEIIMCNVVFSFNTI